MYDDLAAIEDGLAALVATLDPGVLAGPDALVALERACRITKLATTLAMLVGRRVHDTDAWKPSGTASGAHLLANLAGVSLGEAMGLLGTAKKLADLPKTDQAARQGKLSAKQAAEVTKGAAADPAAEDDLLGLADTASTSELSDESKRRRLAAAGDDAKRHARMKANRAMHRFSDDDGSAVMRWRHLPEAGAELDAILADYVDDEFHTARRQHHREPRCAYAADALLAALRDAAAFRRGETLDDERDLADIADDLAGDRPRDDVEIVVEADDLDPEVDADDVEPDVAEPATDAALDHRCAGGPFDTMTAPDRDRSGSTPTEPDNTRATGADDHTATEPPHHVGKSAPPADEPVRPNRRTRRRDGERSPPNRRRRAAPPRRGADAKIIVRIDHAALLRGHTEPGEICDIAGIGPVPVTSVAALMNDAFIAAVLTKGHDVHNVAHLGRAPNTYQQTAKQAEGMRCAVLGCPNTHHLERDHEQDWARTRHTRLDELDWLCPHHHNLKTHHHYRLEPGRGRRFLLSPDQQRTLGLTPNEPARTARPATGGRPVPPTPTRTARPEALTLDL